MTRAIPSKRTVIARSLESPSPPMQPWFHLEWKPERDLTFAVGCSSRPHNPLAAAHPDTFTSGLWKHDVGELFIKHAKDERYLEINLGPYGAWWACRFASYRKPAGDSELAPFKPVALDSSFNESSWETRLTISQRFLRKALQISPTSRANICFILGPADGRHHFSWAPLSHDPPNFHRVEDFVPLC